jgi:hypothetical protein
MCGIEYRLRRAVILLKQNDLCMPAAVPPAQKPPIAHSHT